MFNLMEPNGVGLFSNMTSPGMLGLEMSLHNHHHQIPPPQQNPQNPIRHHQQMVAFGNPEAERRHQQPPQQSAKQVQPGYPFASKSKPLTISDEDEPNPTTEDSGGEGKRNGKGGSPWQRMKWTDNMVRLLIMVVFYIGDEVGSDQAGPDPNGGKKSKGGAGGAVLQKKGKWKSVSRAMMERGFYVSPQQCEDKFNDLNKRYKRVNDILGKGTACKVVENQSLLETMDHLSPKMKEEVKKLLNSKHLFFREMCAYHSSCGGGVGGSSGGGGGGGVHQSPPEVQAEPSHNQQHRCSHASDKSAPVSSREGTDISRMESYDDEDGDHDHDHDMGDEDDEIDDDVVEMAHRENGHNEEEGVLERNSRKRQRKEMALLQQFNNEVVGVVQDVTKSLWEKRQWMKTRLMQLEEARLGYDSQAYELEKQRLKWLKFSWRKEREMEGEKLKNERAKLENDRMVLILRQKEVELLDLQQHSTSRS